MRKISFVFWALMLGLVAACNSGSGSDSSDGSPSTEAAQYDATGLWLVKASFVSSSDSGYFPEEDEKEFTEIAEVIQDGNAVSLFDGFFSGTVDGAGYTCACEGYYYGSVYCEESVTFTLTSENTAQGTYSITCTYNNSYSLTWSYDIEVTKQDIPGSLTLTLNTSALNDDGRLLARYTSDAGNYSPPLSWENVPDETKSMILVLTDATQDDATRWLVYGILPGTEGIAENVAEGIDVLPSKIDGGAWQLIDYTGPIWTTTPHTYHFELFALDEWIDEVGSEVDLLDFADKHMIAVSRLSIIY